MSTSVDKALVKKSSGGIIFLFGSCHSNAVVKVGENGLIWCLRSNCSIRKNRFEILEFSLALRKMNDEIMKRNTTHCEIFPGKGENFSIARFSMYCPPGGDNFKYILSLVPGINEDGTRWLNDEVWLRFSEENNCPVLASYFHTAGNFNLGRILDGSAPKITYYVVPKGGSGRAYLEALQTCMAKSSKTFSKRPGMLLFGYSAGGIFNHNFSVDYPDRVSAFVVNKGGGAYIKGNKEFYKIPGLFFLGENDKEFRKSNIRASYKEGVGHDAPWLLIRESGVEHNLGRSVELSLEFFSKIIKNDRCI